MSMLSSYPYQSSKEKYLNFINTYPAVANRIPQHMLAFPLLIYSAEREMLLCKNRHL
jgi:hypothetical protein